MTDEVRDLVSRAQAGDRAAYGEIYSRYVDQVRALVLRRTGDRQLAEDLAQETFLRALKRIDCFTWRGADLGAWLTTIAVGLVADHYRSGRTRFERVADVHTIGQPDVRPEADPAQVAVDQLTQETLLAGVQQLPDAQRQCVALRYLRGLSIEDTARLMGRTEGAVKMLQRRALRALRVLVPATAVLA